MTILRPSRRDLLKMSAVAPLMGLAAPATANLGGPVGHQPSHFRFSIGAARMTVISDGYFTAPLASIAINADPEAVRAFLDAHFLASENSLINHTNHLIIELGEAKVLVDVGSGKRIFAATSGNLLENMEAAGFAQEDITHVVLTHAHPDHVWGTRDDFDDIVFPDAAYIIGRFEHDWWMKPDRVNDVPETMQQLVVGAVNALTPIQPQLAMAEDGHEVAPGITMMATPGHTLGHMGLRIESEGAQLLVLADSARNAYLDFAHPEWVGAPDMDQEATIRTRRHLMDMAATDKIPVLGYHFPFPGVGHVVQNGSAYRFIPALWRWE